MFEMLVHQRSNSVAVTPLTPVSTPPDAHHHHNSDLSPRSSNSSFISTDSLNLNSSIHHSPNHDRSPQDFSALQRLQFALERNVLFSTMLNDSNNCDQARLLVQPCHSSSNSSVPDSPPEEEQEKHEDISSLSINRTSTPATSPNDETSAANIIFQCPLCAVVCNSRHEFNEHLVTHSQQFACPKCVFLTDDEDKLREHVIEAHDVVDFEGLTDEEVRTPKTNSQGKMKTFKCKQCGYQAVTKMDFWEHTKGHIRSEKMLTCPKCPFVTEYKHHLEYHLRNHFGSKPFQCNKCAYSCVNKSMLNSHLKSHSNIYQYRCADCSYATKYCHSLKLHLRKYDHKPSMVLNPDGTPNPLPIIDVYGTRRGPKMKRQDPNNLESSTTLLSPVTPKEKIKRTPKRPPKSDFNANTQVSNSSPPISPASGLGLPLIKQEFATAQVMKTSPNRNHTPMFMDERNYESRMEQNSNCILQQVPHGIQFNSGANPGLQAFLLQNSSNKMAVNPTGAAAALQGIFLQNSMNCSAIEMIGKSPMELYAAALNQYMAANSAINAPSTLYLTKIADHQRSRFMSQMLQQSQAESLPNLTDTSETQSLASEALNLNSNLALVPLDLRNHKIHSPVGAVVANVDSKKRKRKGKALRYNRNKEFRGYAEECNEALDFSNNNNNEVNSETKEEQKSLVPNVVIKTEIDAGSQACKFCDISFPPVLYELHMRFHSSDSDPFRCNVCGTKSSDKVSFFVHLATASH